MTVLLTPRLRLRPPTWADLPAVHRFLSDPRAMRYWSTPEHVSLAQSEEWLGRWLERPLGLSEDFLVERDGQVIGKAGAWQLPEVGYLIRSDHWGQGLGHEAMAAAVAHLFTRPDVTRLTADVDPRNAASIRLLTRLGFTETHRAERTILWRDEWCDSVYFALERADYRAA